MEISVSMDGDFGEMKKTETPSKSQSVGMHGACMGRGCQIIIMTKKKLRKLTRDVSYHEWAEVNAETCQPVFTTGGFSPMTGVFL